MGLLDHDAGAHVGQGPLEGNYHTLFIMGVVSHLN